MAIQLEFFYSPYCRRCGKTRAHLRTLAAGWSWDRVHFREVNVLDELDRAVSLGVLQTPALAVEGKVVAGGIASPKVLEKLLRQHLGGRE